ncbi:lipoate synthase [Pelagophyceae sp. CCMP2097]|nr:lipoate synthase [Pelagophyceae sp. CCMP2097]|mmetsp:Transcript_20975/g.74577  ORF Transcript_20975/g.74577 Transcript_20975/m.74577 type:complete len:334 (-) Transcript_20975:75-1076(-)
MLLRLTLLGCAAALAPPLATPKVGGPMPDSRPSWFRVPAPGGEGTRYAELRASVETLKLNTVCDEAACPNVGECWNSGTATIMLLGDECTRGCRFCNVKTSQTPDPPDADEPFRAASAIAEWGVTYIVMTSVDRDDLPDGGAEHFAKTVRILKELKPSMLVECLVSDFKGDEASVSTLANSGLDVYAHNIETVRRLTPYVRDRRATYDQSLKCLRDAKAACGSKSLLTKSSVMLGLGETHGEIRETMRDLRAVGCDVLTFGQYLRPTENHLAVHEYVTPEFFEQLRKEAEDEFGFAYCASGPMVRSSYKAGEFYLEHLVKLRQEARPAEEIAA